MSENDTRPRDDGSAPDAPPDPAGPGRSPEDGDLGPAELRDRLQGAVEAGAFAHVTGGRGALMGVPITLRAVLGEAHLPMSRFLALGPDDMVTLDRLVGEPIDLTVNDAPIARGEIVMLDEETGRLGVRVLDLLDAVARTA